MTTDKPSPERSPSGTAEAPAASDEPRIGIDLLWIPLGAGGSGLVRWNGRIYEAVTARLDGRRPLDLYHTALLVGTPEGRYVVETMWPSPDGDSASRGVVAEGAVFGRVLSAVRLFRYEVRCWRDGVLPDAHEAVGGPQSLSSDPDRARRLLGLVPSVPALVWGRDELRTGDMWNSNSVIAWLLARCDLPIEDVRAPVGGRAPGWEAGVAIAQRASV